MQRFRRLISAAPLVGGIALGVAVVALLYGCARDGGAAASSVLAATPEDAITAVVQAQGERYAGQCAQTRSPEDIGKVCSKLIDQRDAMQAHLIGRTFSEFSTWVFLRSQDGGWTVVDTSPLDFHDLSMTIPWPR